MTRAVIPFSGLFLLILALASATAMAEDSVPRAYGPMTSSAGPGGEDYPAGRFAFFVNYMYGHSDDVYSHSDDISSSAKMDKNIEVLKTRYGIAHNFDIRTATPVYQLGIDNRNGQDKNYAGVGDSAIMFHNVLLNQADGDPFYLALDWGPCLPTGSVTPHSADSLGNSAWGFSGGVLGTYFLDRNRFDMEVNMTTTAEGARDYKKGDKLRLVGTYAYALDAHWDLGVESYYESSASNEQYDNKLRDAYNEWFMGPKFAFRYAPWACTFATAVELPVYRWYQSTKVGSDDFRIEAKFSKSFDLGTLF